MSRLQVLSLAICMSVGGAAEAAGQESDLRNLVQKAIDAHGGAKVLSSHPASSTKFKGTVELMGQKRDFTGEMFRHRPDKFRIVSSLAINNQTLQFVHVSNGKKFWIRELGKTREVTDEKILRQTRDTLGLDRAAGLADLLGREVELNSLGEFKVNGSDVIGIRAGKKGADINLFFDKKTHLLVKTELRVVDAATAQEYTQEEFLMDYQDVGGRKTARRILLHKDGNPFLELEFSETQHLDKLDDAHFAMP